jgi:PKD domain
MEPRPRQQQRAAGHAALLALLVAVLLVALAGAAPARAAEYGDGAPIPFLLLPADNPWNTRVDTLPLDPNSADYIAHMSPGTGLHPDFGTVWEGARIGIPYIVVPGTQPKVPIHFTEYGDESDPGPYPIPPSAPVEGVGGPFGDGDRHVLVLDADNQVLYELYHGYKQADGSWNAGSGAVFDLTSNALRPEGWTSCDAAGLPILPGLARYDEIVGEGVLDHALRFTVSQSQQACVYPATHYASDSSDPDLPPMGLRVRLRADFDVSGFPPVVQTLLRGLKKYGMMVADNGADWYVGGAPDPRWDDEALHSLDQVTGADFEVVDSRALLPGAFSVSLPATATAREGTPWARAGSFFDGAGALWTATVDYDGAGGGAGPAPLSLAADKSFELTQTWPDDGRRTVRVVVTSDLAQTAEAMLAVNVQNVAPKVKAGAHARVRAGARFTRTCSFADPGADTWTAWAKYGDGSARRALRLRADKTFRLAHRFPPARGRSYNVVVTVRDDDGGRGTARFRVTVR